MVRNFIVASFLLILSGNLFSQAKDSLLNLARSKGAPDSTRLRAYYDLGWEYIYSNQDSSLQMARHAYELAKKSGDKVFQARVMNLFGSASQVAGKFSEAVEYYQKGLLLGEELKDDNLMLVSYGNIGAMYVNLQQYAKAKEFALKALTIAEKTSRKNYLASIYNNLSLISVAQNNSADGVEYGRKALELYMQLEDKNGMCSATGNVGNSYYVLGEYEKAIEYFNLCRKLAKEVNNLNEEATALRDIGQTYIKQKKFKEAIKITEEALKLENESSGHLQACYYIFYEAYKGLKQTEDALHSYENYVRYKEIRDKEDNEEEVSRRMMAFDFNKKAVADSIKNAEESKFKDAILQANEKQLEKDKQLQIALSVGLVFFILFGVIIFNRFRITAKQKQIIEAKNKQTEEQKLIIEEKQKEILDSITYAKRIQDSLLDDFQPVKKYFGDAFLLMIPKDIVSGDFYWLSSKTFNEPDHVREFFYVAVCDSTGHGVPGGFMSLLNMAYLNEAVTERGIFDPGKIFDYARERLVNTISKSDQSDGFDGVLLCFERNSHFTNGQLSHSSFNFSYASAYNAPLVVRKGEVVESKTDKMPVGFAEKMPPFRTFNFDIEKGDMIYLFSDGYADQFGGPREKKFQFRQLQEMLVSISAQGADEQRENILNRFVEWKGKQMQMDDVSMIGIRV